MQRHRDVVGSRGRLRFSALIAVTIGPLAARAAAPATPASEPPPLCAGSYADDFRVLSSQVREFDRQPQSAFSYCVRNTAVYECLSYGADGAVRHERRTAVLHGTAFAYRRQGADTLLLTNDHVAAWPGVTDAQHAVDGVPAGCKKVGETLALVDDEHDSYGRDDIPVSRVVTDPQLDVAVLKTAANLQVMPWKIGHDARLRERNVVEVRGFPLGAFRATNAGTVISAHDHDDFGEWDHDDFVIDALLSHGNSGSPVLAVSCATGEYELVGIYHAGYSEGSALNVVVGIDQVRDLMTTLKRTAHPHQGDPLALDAGTRHLIRGVLDAQGELFFPFGPQVALVRPAGDDGLLFALFGREFPQSPEPALVIEDLAPGADPEFGRMGRLWIGSAQGLHARDRTVLDAEAQAQAARLLDGLRADAAATAAYQKARRADAASRQQSDELRRMKRALARTGATRSDLLQASAESVGAAGAARGRARSDAGRAGGAPPDHRAGARSRAGRRDHQVIAARQGWQTFKVRPAPALTFWHTPCATRGQSRSLPQVKKVLVPSPGQAEGVWHESPRGFRYRQQTAPASQSWGVKQGAELSGGFMQPRDSKSAGATQETNGNTLVTQQSWVGSQVRFPQPIEASMPLPASVGGGEKSHLCVEPPPQHPTRDTIAAASSQAAYRPFRDILIMVSQN